MRRQHDDETSCYERIDFADAIGYKERDEMRSFLGAILGCGVGAFAGMIVGHLQMGSGPSGSDGDWAGLGVALISPIIGGGIGAIIGVAVARRSCLSQTTTDQDMKGKETE